MDKATCAVDNCGRPVRLTGLCGAHHQRKLRHGDVRAHIPLRGTDTNPNAYWCSRCHTHKPVGEFHRESRARRGVSGVCKSCIVKHRDEMRPRLREQSQRSKAKHADAVRERKRQWNIKNRERLVAKRQAWRKANPERTRAQIRAQNSARYARDKSAAGKATTQQIADRWKYYGGKCWMCGEPATDTDHVKPLARGGCNWPANLRPSCQPCNRSKSHAWPIDLGELRGSKAA